MHLGWDDSKCKIRWEDLITFLSHRLHFWWATFKVISELARLDKRFMARHAGYSYYIIYCFHLMFKFGLLLNFVAHSSQGRDIHWLQTWVGDSYQWLNGLGLNNRFNSLVLALNQTSFIWKHTVFDFIGSELMLRKNPNHLDRHFGKGRFKILSMGKLFFYSLVGCGCNVD